jgi:hypothetical protein
VRLGYAMVGNDTDPYQVINTYTHYTGIDAGNNTPGYVVSSTLKNDALKPETTNSYEVGLEMNFFNDRVGFEATYYTSRTKNQIIPLSLSGSSGYTTSVINSGLISNKGAEFAVHVTPIKTHSFSWESSLTLASNKNKVEELVEGVDYYRLASAPFKVEVGAIKGASYGVIMGTDYLYDANGQRIVNENGLYAATDGNVNLGSVYPDFTGGWSNTFRYRNLDLSVLVDFSKGGRFFSTSYMYGMYSGMLEETAANNVREEGLVLEGVQADGSKNTVRTSGYAYYRSFSTTAPAAQNVLKSDYVKLREINLGYTIPLHRGVFVKSLRVSAYGRNLGVWGPDTKHFDPEMIVTSSGNIQGIEGGAVASVANFGFNVSLKF